MLHGTNLLYTKQYNLRIVHEAIRLYGPLSRADIARRTQLTGQTVGNLVKELIDAELVLEGDRRQEGRGAPSTDLALNPEGAYAVGLDLDRDHLTGVLVDLAGTVLQRMYRTLDGVTPEQALDLMEELCGTLIERQGIQRQQVWGVGVGVPGPMHPAPDGNGYVVKPKAFPGWDNVPLDRLLHDRLGIPVVLENNATAAAIGERWYGEGRHIKTFFYIYFGSGLGGGLVLNGQPYGGHTGNAGEIGYLPTALLSGDMDESPHVGLHFTLPGLYRALRETGEDVHAPEDLDRLLREKNPRLLAWLDDAVRHLTGLVMAVEYLLDPEAVFFGGRLPDSVLQALMDGVARDLPGLRVRGKEAWPRHILPTAGVDAAALGVATLPLYNVFAPAPQVLLKQSRRHQRARLKVPMSLAPR